MIMSKNKRTIVFIAPTPPPYMGPSVATDIILNSRFVDEFDVIHIDTADRRPLNTLAKIDVTNIYLAIKHYFILLKKLLLSKPELVYIPVSQTAIGFLRDVPFVVLSKIFGKKVVLHLRGGYFREFYGSSGRIMKYIIEKTLSRVDRMIVLGECLKALFDDLIDEDKLSVIPNGADIIFNNTKRNTGRNGQVTILFLSNLIETKGFKDVLHSATSVTQRHNTVRYVFAGDWRKDEDKLECEKYIEKEELGDYVKFVGAVTGIRKTEALQNANIFVLPTYYPMEGHPWVIVEAMAAGLPIITTDQGCIKESVINGENGFLIPKRDSDAIAEKANLLIENPRLREQMGRKSRQLYEANFTKEHFVQRMIDTINLTLGSR